MSAAVRVLVVAVRVATMDRSLAVAVAVAKFDMGSTVSCWYSWVVSSSCRRLAE